MTREEAITYLKVIWNRYKAEYEIERETLDAYHIAIEALKGGDAEMLNEDFRPKYMQQSPNNGADLISRADAIDAVAEEWLSEASAESPYVNDYDIDKYRELAEDLFKDIPSADADGDDLIIKGAKGIQDGLYNIKDGKLFKYKAKGGTVRTYPIVPSAETHEIRTETHECVKETHDTDLISRADAIAYIDRVTNSGLGRNKSLDYIHKYISALPSAEAVQGDECDHCVYKWGMKGGGDE